jgi:hypothetical protein
VFIKEGTLLVRMPFHFCLNHDVSQRELPLFDTLYQPLLARVDNGDAAARAELDELLHQPANALRRGGELVCLSALSVLAHGCEFTHLAAQWVTDWPQALGIRNTAHTARRAIDYTPPATLRTHLEAVLAVRQP